jgi:hypothetical protein
MPGCNFVNDLIAMADPKLLEACDGRKQFEIDVIVNSKPDVVIVSNSYGAKKLFSSGEEMTPKEWSDSMRTIVDMVRNSTGKIVFLSPPPSDIEISECFGKRTNSPPDCISQVTDRWREMASAEQDLAKSIDGTWVDSRPWFCSGGRLCPSFVGTTPTKHDLVHMAPAYGEKIAPVIDESFRAAGVYDDV